jgi:hypothetical protein
MNFIELEFDSLRHANLFESKHGHIILFKGIDANVYLDVWVGDKEKDAILDLLQNNRTAYEKTPMKFGAFIIMLHLLGVVASRIAITHIYNEVYQAQIIFLTWKGQDTVRFALRGLFADLMFMAMQFNPRYFVNVEVIKASGKVRDEQRIDISLNVEMPISAKLYTQIFNEKVSKHYPIESGFPLNIPQPISMQAIIIQLLKHKLFNADFLGYIKSRITALLNKRPA